MKEITKADMITYLELEKCINNFIIDFRIAVVKAGGNGSYEFYKNKSFHEVVGIIAPNNLKIIHEKALH